MPTISAGVPHEIVGPPSESYEVQKKRKKKNKNDVNDVPAVKKSKKRNATDAYTGADTMLNEGSSGVYRCPGCGDRFLGCEGLNEHCTVKHGSRFKAKNVTFASEDEFYTWKKLLEEEHQTHWKLVENQESVSTKYFCCPSCKLPFNSKSKLCTSFIKATFSAVVTVQYCLFHFGHRPLNPACIHDSINMIPRKLPVGNNIAGNPDVRSVGQSTEAPSPPSTVVTGKVDKEVGSDPSSQKSAAPTSLKQVPCQQPLSLVILPKNPHAHPVGQPLEAPSYIVVTRNANKEVEGVPKLHQSSPVTNLRQSITIKKEVGSPIVLPSPPSTGDQTTNAKHPSSAVSPGSHPPENPVTTDAGLKF